MILLSTCQIVKKDLEITHEESADTQREFEGSANLSDAIYHVLSIGARTSIEEEFEKRLEHLLPIEHLKK